MQSRHLLENVCLKILPPLAREFFKRQSCLQVSTTVDRLRILGVKDMASYVVLPFWDSWGVGACSYLTLHQPARHIACP